MSQSRPLTEYQIRKIILDQAFKARVGHIGCALSVADILVALYGGILRIPSPNYPDRDRFVLSKGHAALALYAALHLKGWVTKAQLKTYCGNKSWLGVHPERSLTGVDFSTGSLGHGVTYAVGAALAARMQKSSRRIFALVSDAECNEGSLWEAVMFAAHHQLANLVILVDDDKQQAFGYTKDVLKLKPLAKKWRAFGWEALNVNGHDVKVMTRVIKKFNFKSGSPHVILARTTFGKGVGFMQRKLKWHYWPMSEKEYIRALADIEAKR